MSKAEPIYSRTVLNLCTHPRRPDHPAIVNAVGGYVLNDGNTVVAA